MNDFIKHRFDKVINIEKLITVFYMEFSKDFVNDGEQHDFWEMVYIDRGEALCTGGKRKFVLKSGELTFHKPNEFHAIRAEGNTAPNVSIITFLCKSRAMRYFEGKIFPLGGEEKALISMLFREGISTYTLVDPRNPLLQQMQKLEDAPFGGSQMIKNLLEIFLIRLHRKEGALAKKSRYHYKVNGIDIPFPVKEILDLLHKNVYGTLSVAEIAKLLGKSESTVKNLFSLYQSGGIINYYNSLKIEEAKRLIREGNCNFGQIATLLQFDTPQYFSMCFKRFVHMSPQEYKKSILQ
ncbi:MAG: helix-turn-helix domain-containing protein [Clostridia bacterium]|nr:helix-turn-helix domain-containing protein [Clostridia bacterium]